MSAFAAGSTGRRNTSGWVLLRSYVAAGADHPLDMLFGHSGLIAQGHRFMAHKTGFTCASLGQHLVDAGFPVAIVKRDGLNLCTLGLMREAKQDFAALWQVPEKLKHLRDKLTLPPNFP